MPVALPSPPPRPRRIAYLGTPSLAVAPLRALVDVGVDVALVVSRPDRRRGRGGSLTPSPVKAAAVELGLAVTDRLDDVADADVEMAVVVAYGRIIPTSLLERVPMVNLHFSKLPRWRGAAPVERAILAGDRETAVCLMAVEPELDTGGVYASTEVAIGDDETLDELRARLVRAGCDLLVDAFASGLGEPVAQHGEVTYAQKLRPEELHLDWRRPAIELARVVRIGGAWTMFRDRRLKVWRVEVAAPGDRVLEAGEISGLVVGAGEGALELVEVQPEGKGRLAAADWRNGAHPAPGERLG